jgi:hypothetical protein
MGRHVAEGSDPAIEPTSKLDILVRPAHVIVPTFG